MIDTTNRFKFWNRVVGWMVFAIATISYLLTMEPTTSLWAVETGAVEKTRYQSYLRLYEKSSQIKLWELK